MPRHQFIPFDHPNLSRFGRIAQRKDHLEVNYGANGIRLRFQGRALGVTLEAGGGQWQVSWGARIDGGPEIPLLLREGEIINVLIAADLPEGIHDVEIYRRTDPLGGISRFFGLILENDGNLLPCPPLVGPRLHFYGDSITAGGVVMAFGHEGESDEAFALDNYRDCLTNATMSFAGITSKRLESSSEIVGIGGLAVLDHTGWWQGPEECLGWETTWDKVRPWKGDLEEWDFTSQAPDLIIVALGQNCAKDGYPESPDHQRKWKDAYLKVLTSLRAKFGSPVPLLLGTSLMNHDPIWDDLIQQVAEELGHGAHTIRYKRNGCGTPGHLRVRESEEMADELVPLIQDILHR